MKLEALGSNIVVRPVRASTETASGIQLPQSSQDPYEDGAEVISVGPDVERLAPGDIVVRPDPPLYVVTDDAIGEELWLTQECDIHAKMVKDVEVSDVD